MIGHDLSTRVDKIPKTDNYDIEVPVGQKCRTSGVHFSGMFSSESGLSMEKHMRMTSVSG